METIPEIMEEVIKAQRTIPEMVEEVKINICDNYCKYPSEYTDQEQMIEERCENCPLCQL